MKTAKRGPNGEMPRGKPPQVWPEVIANVCGRPFSSIADFARREAKNFGVENGKL
jgi:hypothetical protein